MLPFIIQITKNQSSSRVLDCCKKVHIHLLWFKRRFLYASIVSDLAMLNISSSIFILVSIVDNTIMLQIGVSNAIQLQE
jgi:hypothetical protein